MRGPKASNASRPVVSRLTPSFRRTADQGLEGYRRGRSTRPWFPIRTCHVDFLVRVPRTPTDACFPQHYHNILCRRIMMPGRISALGPLWRGIVFQNISLTSFPSWPTLSIDIHTCHATFRQFFDSQTCLTNLRVSSPHFTTTAPLRSLYRFLVPSISFPKTIPR